MKFLFPMFLGFLIVGCGKDFRPVDQADKLGDNQKEAGPNQPTGETKKEAANTKPESSGKGGEEFLNRLPKAGAWVLHEIELNVELKDDEGKELAFKASGTVKIASLDTEIIEGKRCRAIETELKLQIDKLEMPEAEQEKFQQLRKNLKDMPPIVLNFKFDEVGLQKHENPLKNLVSLKAVLPDGQVQEIPNALVFVGMISPGLKDKAKILEVKEIETKLGKLKCSGDVRNVDLNLGLGEGLVTSLEVLRHESVPFGMVSTLATLKGKDDKTIATLTLKVKEVGKGAVSKLPKSE